MTNERSFEKGEYVVYASNGVCLISDIREFTFAQDRKLYYVLQQINSHGSVIYIPVDNEPLCAKIRYVLTKADIDSLLRSTTGRDIAWIDDRKARSLYFRDILARGEQDEMLLLIRCIYLHSRELLGSQKKLSGSDIAVLQAAEKSVREEFAFSLNITPERVDDYISEALGLHGEVS